MSKVSQPIKYHGGKFYLAPRIIDLFPPHIHYVEPFFGGGAVFFAKPLELIEGHSEVINDINGELVNFWGVLGSEMWFPQLAKKCELTPFAKKVWEASVAADGFYSDPVTRAHAFFIRYRQSRQGLGKDFATLTRNRTRRGMNEQVSSWLSAIDGLPEAHERLKRAVILCEDAVDVIWQQDGENTFVYADPPYVRSTRSGEGGEYGPHEMSDSQHAALLNVLGEIEGKFLLSGYRHPLYDSAALRYGWNRVDIEIDNKASSKKEKEIKVECLWMNYKA